MKQHIKEFFRMGFVAAWGGPAVLAVIYYVLFRTGQVTELPVDKLVPEILTVTLLAFLAGGINVVYRIERLPLFPAILIHGSVLYLAYIGIYLFNGWLVRETRPLLFFSFYFLAGYACIWVLIYLGTRRKTKSMNQKLSKVRETKDN
ncbi:MAG: DUF3021 domain-containing protein [Oscillospiraceae bacterium]|nr:DUF3021 domain-containing protein [Oscillospiraceae bacterium]